MLARRAVEYIEFDVDWCTETFGVYPCRASLNGIFTPSGTLDYQFDDGSSATHSFTPGQSSGGPATFVGGASYATFSGAGSTAPTLTKTVGFSGANVDAIRVALRRTANGASWTGYIYGITASGWFRKAITNPTINVDTIILEDMRTATPGGGESGSWADKTFTSFRLELDGSGTGVIRLYSVELGSLETGNDRCFNTRNTCQDIDSYDPAPTTLRFAKDNGALSKDIYAQAIIKSIEFTPATISIGKDIGIRATLNVTFQDRPHSDTGPGFDKYHALRAYDPFKQGTLWGKFRARQPYLMNATIRYVRGYSDQALVDMESRTFIITKAEMTGASGEFVIEAQDVLRLTDRTRSQCPVQNNGFILNDITDSDSSLILSPTGIGALEYGYEGYANLGGKEIVAYTRDPYARLTAASELLFEFNGADASTTITDTSGKGRNGTAAANAQLDRGEKKWGTASLMLDGTGDRVTVGDNAAWTPGTNFTIEAWIYPTDLSAARTIVGHGSGNTNNEWRLDVGTDGRLRFTQTVGGVNNIALQTSAGEIVINQWQHVAMSKQGTTYRFFVDGALVYSTTDATAMTNFTSNLMVGMRNDGATGGFIGWIDMLHITSSALYTAAFDPATATPPTANVDTLSIVRAQLNTTAKAHSAQDRVQKVVYYFAQNPADVVYDQLATYASVPTGWLDLPSMQSETNSYLQINITGVIAEPTAVDKLLSEICEQCALTIWWDDLNEDVKLRVLRGITSTATYTDDNTINGTLNIEEQPDKRVTQVWIYYGKIDPTESDDNPENYRSVAVTVDLEAESLYGSPAIVKIYSRWIPQGGRTIAQRIGEIILGRFVDPPRMITFEIMRREEDTGLIALGSGVDVQSWALQLPNGTAETIQAQVVRYDPGMTRQRIEAEEFVFATSGDFSDRTIIIETDTYNLNARDLFDSLYPSPDASTVVDIIIESGVVVGSTSTALNAFEVGSWPTGATVNLTVNGRIQGKGGQGGDGSSTSGSLRAGKPGGVALYTRFPINLSGVGEIYGGGGGGGGGGPDFNAGGRGGGGAGTDGGLAGGGRGTVNNGTADAGGAGGGGTGGSGNGGNGGGPGANGTGGSSSSGYSGGTGGARGAAIDGDSYVTETGSLTVLTLRTN
jgi:hypothetical protein